MNLSEQEKNVNNYLISKNGSTVHWEELAQFAKSPQTVKLKTIMKTVSEIKRKYKSAGLDIPFGNITFGSMSKDESKQTEINFLSSMFTTPPKVALQQLVPIVRAPAPPPVPKAQTDFVLDRNMKRVRTNQGLYILNDNEWDMIKYFHSNCGRLIPISELRDKVVFPHYGSKTPARWFDSIMRIINNLRRAIPDLKSRLLTVKSTETSYLFQ